MLLAALTLATVSTVLAPGVAGAQGGAPAAVTPVAEVDIGSFSARAQAWTSARSTHREQALDRADELAAQAKAAEEARLAQEEADRLAAEEEAARRAAEEAARRATTTTTTLPPTTSTAPAPAPPPPAGGPTPEQWAALRRCESSGDYAAVNPNGRYRGAYQFSQATWDWVAGARAPELVGVDPAAAAPAQQDAQASYLHALRGASPWPHCGVHLR